MSQVEIQSCPGGIEFSVKVVPGASRTRLSGTWGEALKVAVAAPPEGGQANEAVIALLAEHFGVSRRAVTLVSGQHRPVKRVRILGLSAAAARGKLA